MANLQQLSKEINGILNAYAPAQSEMLGQVLMYHIEQWALQFQDESYNEGYDTGMKAAEDYYENGCSTCGGSCVSGR